MADGPSIERYAAMLQMRHFDEACLEGVPTLEIHGELHTAIGQEGIAAGMIGQLRDHDALVSTHRNHYHAIAKGVQLRALLAEIYEKETGLCRGRGGHMHPFDPEHSFSATGIVGATLPVALGYANAFWMQGTDNVAIAITGDGGTNHGTFHECLNIAGAWRLPFIVLVENNHIAISVPFSRVSATARVAERAGTYGAWGRKVEGTDPDIVEAVTHARNGRGPALLEATCFRFRGHYEGDHDSYRDRKERERMQQEHAPVLRYREKLIASGVAEEVELLQLEADSRAGMWALLADVRRDRMPDAAGALEYRYVEATA